MNKLKQELLKKKLASYSAIGIDVIGALIAIGVALSSPHLIGCLAIVAILIAIFAMDIKESKNSFVGYHQGLFHTVFRVCMIITVIALVLILFKNGPTSLIGHGGSMNL